jgi:hypothetical protein
MSNSRSGPNRKLHQISFLNVLHKGYIGKAVPVFNHYATKTYGGVDVQAHVFVTSALVGSEWSASSPARSTPGERAPGAH